MTLEQLIGFSVFAFVACVTPGPNNMLLTAVGGSRGIRRGLPTLMGVAFGFALMLFLVAIGVGRTVLALEHFSGTVRWVGAAFLLWLAWNIASAPVANPTSPTQREFCRFSLFSTTQVIELLESCTPNSPQYRL